MIMEYKEYFAIINYDIDNDMFIGKVINTNDFLSFHGKTINEIEEMFYQNIDNYLETCNTYNKIPSKNEIIKNIINLEDK